MNYIITFFFSLVASLVLTPIVRKAMLKLGILDMPNESRWHRQPVALMGGIAIFTSFALVALLRVELKREIFVILLGGGIIFALGLLDDLFLTVFWIVGLINALNFLDNMDGLSSGITIIAALAIFGLSLQKGEASVPLLSLALAGSCLGFLRYNFNPAKIFMGDCGSLFLGYMLATLALVQACCCCISAILSWYTNFLVPRIGMAESLEDPCRLTTLVLFIWFLLLAVVRVSKMRLASASTN